MKEARCKRLVYIFHLYEMSSRNKVQRQKAGKWFAGTRLGDGLTTNSLREFGEGMVNADVLKLSCYNLYTSINVLKITKCLQLGKEVTSSELKEM